MARWSAIQEATPSLASPFFSPEFTRIAAAVRTDVKVAVLEDDGGILGFFPFQQSGRGVAHPVGGRMSDFQGVIAPDGVPWDGPALLRACGVPGWRFDHLLSSQEPLRPFHWSEAASPYIDLTKGFEAYRRQRKTAGSKEIETALYKARKAGRRGGALRFELHTPSDLAFEMLLKWKAEQYRANGLVDIMALPWVVRLLDSVRRADQEGLSGVMSALYFDDRLAAVHLGMRSKAVLHYWMPAYDPELSFFSPGQICIVELARAAASEGVRRIDLGKGDEPYKARMASGSVSVAEGLIDFRPGVALLEKGWYELRNWARVSPLRQPLLGPARWLRRTAAALSRH
jgi:CelD/BcsL family acetyltransferase involved in cellulose biosynthesis